MPKRFLRIAIVVIVVLVLLSGGLFAIEAISLRRARIPWKDIPRAVINRMFRDARGGKMDIHS